MLKPADRYGWKPVLLHYANSGDTAGDKGSAVGYAAIAFYGEKMEGKMEPFNETQGGALVRLARRTLAEALRLPITENGLDEELEASDFDRKRGTFVTLTIDGQLRGCIGSLSADEPVREGVRKNAINAAFHDPRFPKLTAGELKRVAIEVSILTEPVPLAYQDADDLLAKLKPDVDGVILGKGMARATFLPQVWRQLPGPDLFLSQLCLKAGLAADAWKKQRLEVLVYQVQYFEEHP